MLKIFEHPKNNNFHIVNEENKFLSNTKDQYGNIRFITNMFDVYGTCVKEEAENYCESLNKKHRK